MDWPSSELGNPVWIFISQLLHKPSLISEKLMWDLLQGFHSGGKSGFSSVVGKETSIIVLIPPPQCMFFPFPFLPDNGHQTFSRSLFLENLNHRPALSSWARWLWTGGPERSGDWRSPLNACWVRYTHFNCKKALELAADRHTVGPVRYLRLESTVPESNQTSLLPALCEAAAGSLIRV